MTKVGIACGALAAGLVLASCGGDERGGEAGGAGEVAEGVSHIHGLAVDGSGNLHVASHTGLIRAPEAGAWVYASGDRNDHMGFSLDPKSGTMWRSGHSLSRPSLGVERSTDGGATWRRLSDVLDPPVDFHAMAVSHADGQTLWGWDSGRRGLFRSADGGETWGKLPQTPFAYVLAGPARPGVVFAGTPEGLLRSDDGGATWQPVEPLMGGWVIGVAADPNDGTHLLAYAQQGMKVSTDGGRTWNSLGEGLPKGAELAHLAISPVDGRVAYAADASTIYRTTDGGKTWSEVRPPS